MTVPMLKLADCITLIKGKPPAAMPYFGDDAEPYLSPEYLRGRGMAEPAKPAANGVRVKDGDTILLWDGSNAGEVFRARAGLLASTMTHIRHGEEFEPEYFCYAAKRWEAYLKGQTSGSGIPHVDKEVFGKLEILKLPPYEQKLVAHILNKLDRAIEQTEALIAKQQRIKTGLMQDLLTKGIDAHGNIRSEATHAFKDSPLGRIPVEWDVLTLSEATSKLITYGIVQPGPHVPDGVPFVQTKDLTKGRLAANRMDRTSIQIHSAYMRSSIRKGDILIGIRASVGLVCEVPSELDGSNISRGVARLSPSKRLVSRFLYWIVQANAVQNSIRSEIKGSTYPEITLPALRAIQISVPNPEEQKLIAQTIDAADWDLDEIECVCGKLQELKAGLMHDLLTGNRRVTPLLEQAATQ